MELTSLQTLATCAGGRLQLSGWGDPSLLVSGISTDSRSIGPGEVYLALRGSNFDGHAFIRDVQAKDAVGAIVDARYSANADDLSSCSAEGFVLIIVEDTLAAYQRVAAWHRRRTASLEVVGITGSNGKTTTKDFVSAVLDPCYCVLKTEGNLNNHIGVPRTLLRLNNTHDVAIVEMGINHPGEMLPLTRMASPTAGIVTNIGSAHLEFMGTKRGTALEKSVLLSSLPQDGIAILNGDDEFSDFMEERTRGVPLKTGLHRGVAFAEKNSQVVDGTNLTVRYADGEITEAKVHFPGKHVVANALFALALGRAFNLSPRECAAGLAEAKLTAGRVELKTVKNVRFLDDSYNANPESMVASLDALSQLPIDENGQRIAVLGSMGELGAAAEAGYRTVGEAAGKAKLDLLISVGADAAELDEPARRHGAREVINVPTTIAAAEHLAKAMHPGDVVLVKGSRSARMEKVIEVLLSHSTAPDSA